MCIFPRRIRAGYFLYSIQFFYVSYIFLKYIFIISFITVNSQLLDFILRMQIITISIDSISLIQRYQYHYIFDGGVMHVLIVFRNSVLIYSYKDLNAFVS